ncbi:hypothetical protein [Cupriavidus sp. USMAHM13]|uniref:hypothetical protein n=1 Tax=Cupriavidus sp. USMAHM13 TaxID=1389192 RepID=UPI0012EACB41|nr:hypothetical protein [Cupriavidus sp. USMAHM13]
MRRLLTGECHKDNIFELVDPTQFVEIDFEAEVVKALACLLPDYLCGVFAGTFVLEGERRVADLALIHKSLSHWFVVEVELAGHSLEHHVLPQVRCFRYGEPEASCVTSLTRAFEEINRERAESLLRYVPRYVAVVGNLHNSVWETALHAVDVQYLTISIYRDRSGRTAHELEGRLNVRAESLGFARYSAIDNSLRIPKGCGLPTGNIQIVDQFGNCGDWTVRETAGVLWVSKDRGPALIDHESYVQLIRSFEGRISIRPSNT